MMSVKVGKRLALIVLVVLAMSAPSMAWAKNVTGPELQLRHFGLINVGVEHGAKGIRVATGTSNFSVTEYYVTGKGGDLREIPEVHNAVYVLLIDRADVALHGVRDFTVFRGSVLKSLEKTSHEKSVLSIGDEVKGDEVTWYTLAHLGSELQGAFTMDDYQSGGHYISYQVTLDVPFSSSGAMALWHKTLASIQIAGSDLQLSEFHVMNVRVGEATPHHQT